MAVIGLPHRLVEDDVYDGVFIPKNSLVRRFRLSTCACSMFTNYLLDICEHLVRPTWICTLM